MRRRHSVIQSRKWIKSYGSPDAHKKRRTACDRSSLSVDGSRTPDGGVCVTALPLLTLFPPEDLNGGASIAR